jgi:hypothetical protein
MELQNPEQPVISLWKTQYSPLITCALCAAANCYSGSAVSHIAV